MKIVINENENFLNTEIIINCKHTDEEVLKLLTVLRTFDNKLTGSKDGKTHILEPLNILYFDTVDKKTFIYTANDAFETDLRLYELEERLGTNHFFRSSKSAIINISKIKTIVPDFGGRLEVTLVNNEKLFVSRQYAHDLKRKLEI